MPDKQRQHRTPRNHDLIAPLYDLEAFDETEPDFSQKRIPRDTSHKIPAVDFAWDEIEGASDPPDPDVLADQVVADCLAWVMSFCLAGSKSLATRGSQSVAFRRFVALAYIYRPDLIKGRTIRQIAAEIEVSKQAVNRYISEISQQLGASGVNQLGASHRVECRLRQLRDRTPPSNVDGPSVPEPDPPADP
jgi:hypothetical protein